MSLGFSHSALEKSKGANAEAAGVATAMWVTTISIKQIGTGLMPICCAKGTLSDMRTMQVTTLLATAEAIVFLNLAAYMFSDATFPLPE